MPCFSIRERFIYKNVHDVAPVTSLVRAFAARVKLALLFVMISTSFYTTYTTCSRLLTYYFFLILFIFHLTQLLYQRPIIKYLLKLILFHVTNKIIYIYIYNITSYYLTIYLLIMRSPSNQCLKFVEGYHTI